MRWVFSFKYNGNKSETQKILLPTLFKGNYLVLNNFYTLGLFLDVGLINSFYGKRYKLIRLGIDTIKHIGGKKDNQIQSCLVVNSLTKENS